MDPICSSPLRVQDWASGPPITTPQSPLRSTMVPKEFPNSAPFKSYLGSWGPVVVGERSVNGQKSTKVDKTMKVDKNRQNLTKVDNRIFGLSTFPVKCALA